MTIVSDVDGVLSRFESAWEPLLAKLNGKSNLPVDWRTNPGFPDQWDWDLAAYGKKVVGMAWEDVRQSPKFWTTLDPMPGAKEAAKQFNAIQRKHDVFFLTSRVGLGVQSQTCKWLYNLGVNFPNVIVVSRYQDKWALLHALDAGFFVDDKLETMTGWLNHTKTHTITSPNYFGLIDQPYNREGRPEGMKVAANITDALKEAGLWT